MLLGAVQTKMARESGSAGGLGDVDGGVLSPNRPGEFSLRKHPSKDLKEIRQQAVRICREE